MRLITIFIITIALFLTAWKHTRQHFDEEVRQNPIAITADNLLLSISDTYRTLMHNRYIFSLIGKIFPIDYKNEIENISAQQLHDIIQYKYSALKGKKILIYIYNPNPSCRNCTAYLEQVNNIAFDDENDSFFVISLAVDSSPSSLSNYFNSLNYQISFKPYIIAENNLSQYMHNMLQWNIAKQSLPYLALVKGKKTLSAIDLDNQLLLHKRDLREMLQQQ